MSNITSQTEVNHRTNHTTKPHPMSHQNFDQSHEAAKVRMTNVNDNLNAVTLLVAPHSYTPLLHSLLPNFVMHPAGQANTAGPFFS